MSIMTLKFLIKAIKAIMVKKINLNVHDDLDFPHKGNQVNHVNQDNQVKYFRLDSIC